VKTMEPQILFEDNHLLVAVKPHMLPVQQDSSHDPDMLTLLKQYIKIKYQKPGDVYLGLVHRLDRPAGGVMVFARTSKAAARLSDQIRQGTVEKQYLAVTKNPLVPASGTLFDYLIKDSATNTVRVAAKDAKGAKPALLHYDFIDSKDHLHLALIRLVTGRSHQIRVQFASRGCPLYGDARYGRGEGEHLALWSYSLSFDHPTTKERMTFQALPQSAPFIAFDLQKLI